MPKFDHIFSVVYLSLSSPLLFENELDMMCIRKGNYVRSKNDEKEFHCLGNTESPKGVSQIAGREG